ncbi:MAG: hypothetical protein QM820_30205 [Minicystis sp.]
MRVPVTLPMSAPPDLDEPCGEHFTYRDLIACGETWHRLTVGAGGVPFDNVPRAVETFAAMRELCASVLDPVVRCFGAIELTHAFASPRLTRHVTGLKYPPVDQHAGYELNRAGKLVCPRRGLSADFRVRGRDSHEVALWVAEHTAFDRLYFYASDRPFHVSVGPEATGQIVIMWRGPSGRLLPRVMTRDTFARAISR